jgi:hypothetical protein
MSDRYNPFHRSVEELEAEKQGREAKKRCRFCGKPKSDCHGGGFDDGIPAHDFALVKED